MNYGASAVNLKISINGLDPNSLQSSGSTKSVLTSANVMDENSFSQPKKVPRGSIFPNASFTIEPTCSSMFDKRNPEPFQISLSFCYLILMQVVPIQSLLQNVGKDMNVIVPPHSFTLLDLLKETNKLMMPESDSSTRSSI